MVNTKDIFDWNLFLRQWSRDLLERLEDNEFTSLSSEIIDDKWLGYSRATETDISTAEARLKTTFPPSYRSFLAASNGWQKLNDMINKLFSTQEVDWLAARNQELIDAWITGSEIGGRGAYFVPDEKYFIYGDEQDSILLRNEYLQTALQISEDSTQGLLLLNPQIVSENGEWEAWFFATWLPGAHRSSSFRELMQAKHRQLLKSIPRLREII